MNNNKISTGDVVQLATNEGPYLTVGLQQHGENYTCHYWSGSSFVEVLLHTKELALFSKFEDRVEGEQ